MDQIFEFEIKFKRKITMNERKSLDNPCNTYSIQSQTKYNATTKNIVMMVCLLFKDFFHKKIKSPIFS